MTTPVSPALSETEIRGPPLLRGAARLRGEIDEQRRGDLRVRRRHGRIPLPDRQCRYLQGEPGFWSVSDVDHEIAELKKRGVVFKRYDDMPGERSVEGAVIAGGAKAAWFKDSEGNILALIEPI